jgi:cell filamentation protein
VFDPFGDYDSCGYLRNTEGEKDLEIIKIVEHELFRAQLPLALDYLAQCPYIEYADFLETHRILFSDFYPWAGKDRNALLPDRLVHKGKVYFCHQKTVGALLLRGYRLPKIKNKFPLDRAP